MKKVIVFGILILSGKLCYAQKDPKMDEINAVVTELFDAYRVGDSARVANVFTPDAKLQTIYLNAEGQPVTNEAKPIAGFIEYIGKGLTELHDEKLWDTQIFSDKMLATVWTRYAFYLDGKFTHCGTETFLLRKLKGTWKIFYLVDSRQITGCQVPKDLE